MISRYPAAVIKNLLKNESLKTKNNEIKLHLFQEKKCKSVPRCAFGKNIKYMWGDVFFFIWLYFFIWYFLKSQENPKQQQQRSPLILELLMQAPLDPLCPWQPLQSFSPRQYFGAVAHIKEIHFLHVAMARTGFFCEPFLYIFIWMIKLLGFFHTCLFFVIWVSVCHDGCSGNAVILCLLFTEPPAVLSVCWEMFCKLFRGSVSHVFGNYMEFQLLQIWCWFSCAVLGTRCFLVGDSHISTNCFFFHRTSQWNHTNTDIAERRASPFQPFPFSSPSGVHLNFQMEWNCCLSEFWPDGV